MEIIKISESVSECQLSKLRQENAVYAVDPNNYELRSINGNVYSRDMSALLLISDIYQNNPYYMPDTVEKVHIRGKASRIEFGHFSDNLKYISGEIFKPDRMYDLRNTRLEYLNCKDPLWRMIDYIRFPVGIIKDSYGSQCLVTKHEIIIGGVIKVIFDIKDDYTVPEEITEVQTGNVYLDLAHTKQVCFKTFTLSSTVKLLSYTLLLDGVVQQFRVAEGNHTFFTYDDCLYSKAANGQEYILMHIPKHKNSLTILEGTTEICANVARKMVFEKITFPKTIKNINSKAFCECTFLCDADVYAKQIEADAFSKCQGKNIYLHSTELFESAAFANSIFDAVDMTDTKIISTSRNMFREAAIDEIRFPESFYTFGEYSFYSADISKIDVSHTALMRIQNSAFAYSTLKEILLPENLEVIEQNALSYTQLTTLTIHTQKSIKIHSNACSSNDHLQQVKITGKASIDARAFAHNPELTDVQIDPDSSIAKTAFQKCPKLRTKPSSSLK